MQDNKNLASKVVIALALAIGLGLLVRGVSPAETEAPKTYDEAANPPPKSKVYKSTPKEDTDTVKSSLDRRKEALAAKRVAPSEPAKVDQYTEISKGLSVSVLSEGKGDPAGDNHKVTVDYVGWLADGKAYDSSYKLSKPLTITLGKGETFKGFEAAISGMKEGEVRQAVISPELAFGESGRLPIIPANATLTLQIRLIRIR